VGRTASALARGDGLALTVRPPGAVDMARIAASSTHSRLKEMSDCQSEIGPKRCACKLLRCVSRASHASVLRSSHCSI